MKFGARIGIVAVLFSVNSFAQKQAEGTPPPRLERMSEALESSFALSAAPPHLRESATVYLLDPARGYVVSRQGTNGFSCIVVRSDWQWADQSFRDDIFWPVCYDSEGSKTLLQDYLYTAELRAHGMDARQVHEEVTKKFGTAAYPNPTRTGIAYMIAPIMRGYTNAPEPATMNMPHYMFYAPNLKDADIGGHGFSQQYPFILSMNSGRDDYIILLVGETEKAKILVDSKDMLAQLCSYRNYLCTTAATRARTPMN
jgi:hypothetical protein